MSTTELPPRLHQTMSMSSIEGEQERKKYLYVDPSSDDPFVQEQPTAFIMKLYEMINGAPDDVIAWTPEGDAFIIGADLITLEKHTLPRFFRHNRFQSFVRQLNFYSFRKINRERTMWVYKHDLFHRDRPEDLVRLRRRTCPSIDGRRQNFSISEKKPTGTSPITRNSSVSSTNGSHQAAVVTGNDKKRQISSLMRKNSVDKIVKRPSINGGRSPISVDMGVVNPVPLTESEDSDDQNTSLSSVSSYGKAEDQAMIVLKIASQLAQHVRDPKNESRVSGLVTPTNGTSRSSSISSGTLLTYDDEREKMIDGYDHIQESQFACSSASPCDPFEDIVRNTKPSKTYANYNLLSQSSAEEMMERLLNILDEETREKVKSRIEVACFCMTTVPSYSDVEVLSAIRFMLKSFPSVASDYSLYRSALSPLQLATNGRSNDDAFYQMWVHEESRCETYRSFSVFAINCMQTILRAIDDVSPSIQIKHKNDIATLERTISVWQSSSINVM